jgi:hypothetical protein
MMTLTERDNTNILDSLRLKRDVPAGSLFAVFGAGSDLIGAKAARFRGMSRAQQSGRASPNILGTVENGGGPPLRFGRQKRLGSYHHTRIRGRRSFLEGRRERTVIDDDHHHGGDGPSILARIRVPR